MAQVKESLLLDSNLTRLIQKLFNRTVRNLWISTLKSRKQDQENSETLNSEILSSRKETH